MNGNCKSCPADHLCIYEYKPTDCSDMRKFKASPNMVACDECGNTGYKPYPLKCRKCNGTGAIIKD